MDRSTNGLLSLHLPCVSLISPLPIVLQLLPCSLPCSFPSPVFLHHLHLIPSLKSSHYFGLGRVVLLCFPLPAVPVCLSDPAVQTIRSRGLFGISILQTCARPPSPAVGSSKKKSLFSTFANPRRDFSKIGYADKESENFLNT